MTQATERDYWISPNAFYIELNAMGLPDYIQASCVSGAKILVYIKDIISYDAGHNYKRWTLQASPTVFNTHTAKYVYAAVPRSDDGTKNAFIVFPSEELDVYGKNVAGQQIGSEEYYYVFLQGIITSSGDNGTENRDWQQRVSSGLLASDEAISATGTETEWYKYSSVDGIVTFLKNLTMKVGTLFRNLFVETLTIVSGGKIAFENQGEIEGIADNSTSVSSTNRIVTPKFLDDNTLSSVSDDTAQGLITFAKGLISEMLAQLKGGATFGKSGYKFDKDGNVVVDALSSLTFDEALERGFGITKNTQGKYTLSVTDLMVWGKAVFNSLEIRKLYSVGGNVYLSGASSKLQHVSPVTDADGEVTGWKCYILGDDGTTATQNGWARYDQAKCQTFDIKEGVYENVSNTYYWRLVTDVSTENETITETYTDADGKEQTRDLYDGKKFGWVILSKTDCESTTNDAPKAGDTIVLDGHRMFASGDAEGRDQYNDESRTNVMMLETTGTENGTLPRIVALTGIVDYRHWDGVNQYSNTVFILSPKEVVFVSSSFKFMSASGDPITLVNFRGNWAERTEYRYYDQVSHNDSIWTCIVEKGKATTAEPSDTSKDWRKEISGGKGDPAVTYELVASPSYIKLDADGSFDRSNQYREGQMLLVRGYKIVGGKRITQWGDADNPISIQISFNDGAAWYESTFNNGESGLDEVYNDFEPTCEDSYFSMLQEMKKNGLKNCKAVMYEGESLDPDKIPSDKVLARIDIPIVQDGKDGASGTSYGVTLTVEKRTISSVEDDCLVVTFTKGDTDGVTTTNNVQDIGGYAQLYVDGKIDTSATARLNLGTSEAGELQKGAFPQVFTAGYVTVKWYDKEGGTLLGTGSLTRGADGKDATVYGVQVGSYYEWTSGGKLPGLEFGFTKTTGATVGKVTDVRNIGCTVMIYGDGTYYSSASGWINEGNGNFLFSTFPYGDKDGNPTLGDASVVCVELYLDGMLVATANYANGKQGADGKGALEIICDPETIVLDTDDNGLVKGTDADGQVTGNADAFRAALMCVRDGKVVDNVTYNIGEHDTVNCEAKVNNVGVVKITKVNTQTVTIDSNTVTVSCTSGSVTVSVTENATGVTYTKTVPFTVNVAKYTGGLKADNKKLQSQYSQLTNYGSVTDLVQYKSEILQTAKEISLKVSEKSVGRRNMLVGSACRKYGDGFKYMSGSETQYYDGYPLEQIGINSGIDGVNCIHCRTKRTGTDIYFSSGFQWTGNSPQGNIKLEKGKNYVLSFYAKTPTPNDIYFIAEVLYQGSKIDTSRPAGYKGPTGYSSTFSASEANKWELFTVKLSVPSNAKYEYEEINIFARSKVDYFVDGYICKPMLEDGEEYNGWTLSEQDYDYVGGNLLDGTGTLTKTGNVEVLDETTVKQDGYNNESASVKAILLPTMEIGDFLQYSTKDMGLKVGEDCMLSFYARAASGYAPGGLQCYLYSPSTGIVLTESSHEKLDFLWNPGDGDLHTHITPTTAWKRYWVHWRPMGNVPQYILFRLLRPGTNKESYDSSTSYNVGDVVLYGGTYYVCQKAGIGYAPGASSHWEATEFAIEIARPKLEVGATMTEWTEKRADMVDKRALLATGIDLKNGKIIATANNFVVQNNRGTPTFSVDADGNIVGSGGASFNGPMKATTFTLNSKYFSVKEDGTITATGGQVSFFRFDAEGMASPVEYDSSQNKPWRGIGFSSNNISVSGYTGQRISSVFLGKGLIDSRFAGSDKNYIVHRVGSTSSASTFYNYIKLERFEDGHDSYENDPEYAALGIETQGDFCLAALGGPSLFAGMCFASNTGGSFSADKKHCFYLCEGGTFKMPSDPPDGMLIVVIQTGSRKINFEGNGHGFQSGTNYSQSCNSNAAGQWTLFYYDGWRWNTVYMNGRPW